MEDDEGNPCRWVGTAKVGQPSEVLVGERLGVMHVHGDVVLLDDGAWYMIEPPQRLPIRPVAWRYALRK